jgi:hypothetical protein
MRPFVHPGVNAPKHYNVQNKKAKKGHVQMGDLDFRGGGYW